MVIVETILNLSCSNYLSALLDGLAVEYIYIRSNSVSRPVKSIHPEGVPHLLRRG